MLTYPYLDVDVLSYPSIWKSEIPKFQWSGMHSHINKQEEKGSGFLSQPSQSSSLKYQEKGTGTYRAIARTIDGTGERNSFLNTSQVPGPRPGIIMFMS
jgi:hypothetical protein